MSNILPIHAVRENFLQWGEYRLTVSPAPQQEQAHAALVVGIRPEAIRLLNADPARTNSFPVQLLDDEDFGHEHRLTVRIPQQQPDLEIRIPAPELTRLGLRPGDKGYIQIDPASIHIFP